LSTLYGDGDENKAKLMGNLRDRLPDSANQLVKPSTASTDSARPQGGPGVRLPAWLEESVARPVDENQMRDIRDDLQERAKMLDEQIKSERDQFDGLVAQLKQEHGANIERLKAEIDAVKRVMGFEDRRLSNAAPPAP
jgi:hypothetical protein